MMTHPDKLAAFIRSLATRPAKSHVDLVINGDLIDFLAEEHAEGSGYSLPSAVALTPNAMSSSVVPNWRGSFVPPAETQDFTRADPISG
jgi:hypothetical protein